jgi:DNA-binding winged helix-turn-helix (wHTH) protein
MAAGSYRFGPFEVERAAFRVVRQGAGQVDLSPKLLDVLLHLLDHAGELVTKDALLDAVWPHANVTDNAVAQAVSELRQALGDDSASPRFIKTVARRGYRFIAPVEGLPGRSSGDGPQAQAAAPAAASDHDAEPRDAKGRHLTAASARGTLPASAAVSLGARETSSLDAYRAAMEGSLRIESLEVAQLQQAIDDFGRAVALDGRYALAHTGLAAAQFALYESTRCDNEPADDLLERAIDHARIAIALDAGSAEAHATLALPLVSAWRTEEAIAEAERAAALEPGNWRHQFRLAHASWGDRRLQAAQTMLAQYPAFAFAHFEIAMVHVARGDLRQAETVLRRGATLQDRQREHRERFPALGLHWLLGLVCLAQHDADGAFAAFDRELLLADPARLYGREYAMAALCGRAMTLLGSQRCEEAIEDLQRAMELYPDYPQAHLALAGAFHQLGATDGVRTALARVDAAIPLITRTKPIEAAIVRAMRHVAAAEPDRAADRLARMLDEAPPGFAGWAIPIEPLLAPLAGNARFAGVLHRLAGRAR